MKIAPHKSFVLWILLIILHGVVLAAGFVAPSDPIQQDRERPYAPPAAIHFVDAQGKFHVRPFAYAKRLREGSFDEYEDDRATRVPLKFFVTGTSYRVLGFLPANVHLFSAESGTINLLGTDGYGRDLFSRILYGGQISLLAGLLAAAVPLLIGTVVGSASGYFGGWTDSIAMRLAELCLALPWLYLLFGMRAFLPLLVSPLKAFLIVVVTIGALGWTGKTW